MEDLERQNNTERGGGMNGEHAGSAAQSSSKKTEKSCSREERLPETMGGLEALFIRSSHGRSVLEWFHVLPCSGVSVVNNRSIKSSVLGCLGTVLLWHPAVLHWGQRSRLGQNSRVEFQYSAAYSVPWSPLHSSVNSFTMSFTLRLFTRSLYGGERQEGQRGEDKSM